MTIPNVTKLGKIQDETYLNTNTIDHKEWHNFKNEFNKTYESKDVEYIRRSIYGVNKANIDAFNELLSEELGFEVGVNDLTDLSKLEIKSRNGFKLPEGSRLTDLANSVEANEFLEKILSDNTIDIPDEVDWRKVPGRVSPVKNQGQCGSCWAFASTGALEGQEMVRGKFAKKFQTGDNLTELSEQNLVDCVKKDYGCNGGFMADALDFVKEEGGIDSEQSYPYEARTRKCRFRKENVAFSDAGSAVLPTGDEQKLKEVVAKFGPVAVAIDASSIWFQFYRRGVYYNKHCKSKEDQLDHGVLVVGYGTDPKKGDYWIVKNSWGKTFGEKGYIRMARNRNNNCGIATVATIPTF